MVAYDRKDAKAWAKQHVKDFYMCPLTPVTEDFRFDEAGIHENIEKYIDWGVTGLVVGGFVSECWNVKLSDWMRYHEVVADAVKGRVDLWTIILDPSVHQALEKLDFVEKLGYNGAEVINPVVQLRSDDEIYGYFKYMSDHSNLALWLYRTAVSGKVISVELIQRLAELDTVVGVKQGSMNFAETIKIRQNVPDNFVVSHPDEYFFLQDLREGGQVLWGELSYIIYGKKRAQLREYVDLARAGKWEEAYAKWETLKPIRGLMDEFFTDVLMKTSTYAAPLANMKAWYKAMGLKSGPMLPPVRSATKEREEYVAQRLSEAGVI